MIWHIDIHYLNHQIGSYLFAIIDDCSRYVIDFQYMNEKTSTNTSSVMARAFSLFGTPYAIWADNGGENKGEMYKLLKDCNVQIIHTEAYTPQQNDKIERIWPSVEENCNNPEDLQEYFINYNNKPHMALPINLYTDSHFTPQDYYNFEKKWDFDTRPVWFIDGHEQDFNLKTKKPNVRSRDLSD